MAERTEFVFVDKRGHAVGVVEGSHGKTVSGAWKVLMDDPGEMQTWLDEGIHCVEVPYQEYVDRYYACLGMECSETHAPPYLAAQLTRATDELNQLHADVVALRHARDDARRQRDCEAERADQLLEQRDAAVRTRNAVADSVAKLKAAHRAELDTLQARLTVAAQEIERLRAIPDLTDEERAAFLAASNPEVPHVGA